MIPVETSVAAKNASLAGFCLPGDPQGNETPEALLERFQSTITIFDRLLGDVGWSLMRRPCCKIVVVAAHEIPIDVQRPPWPLDIMLEYPDGRVGYMNHIPQSSAHTHEWPIRLNEEILLLMGKIAIALDGALGAVSIADSDYDWSGHGVVDWASNEKGIFCARMQQIHPDGSIRWFKTYGHGEITDPEIILDLPLNWWKVQNEGNTWNLYCAEGVLKVVI